MQRPTSRDGTLTASAAGPTRRPARSVGVLAALGLVVSLVSWAAPVGPAAAGPAENESPAAKMKKQWEGADDETRKSLLADVVSLADAAGFASIATAASLSCDVVEHADALDRKVAGDDASGADADRPLLSPRDREALGKERGERARALLALLDLGSAGGTVLDALSDAEFAKLAAPLVDAVAKDGRRAWADFVTRVLGGTRKDRTTTLLLATQADALKDARKALAARAGPAAELEKVQQRIADLVTPYLKKQQEAGDYSAKVPVTLLGKLPEQAEELQREIHRLQEPVDAAETRRRVARDGLGLAIAGQSAAAQAKSLDVVEKQLLTSADVSVRAFGLGVLAPIGGDRAFARLSAAAAEPDPAVVVAALDALGQRDEPEAVSVLARSLVDTRWQVRAAAAAGLAKAGRAAGVPPLVLALRTAVGRTLDDVREALVTLTGKRFAASEVPWKAWWDKEGAAFRGPRDERPAGSAAAAADASAKADAAADADEGGVTFYGIQTHSTRMLFVLDLSGSMNFPASDGPGAKKKVETLRSEVKRTVTGMADGSIFDVVVFSYDVRVWKKDPVVRSSKTAQDAIAWVDKADAIGGTNIHDALETAFKLAKPAQGSQEPMYDTIFFMTDGTPSVGKVTDPDAILREVRRWNDSKKIRIHVIGMGGHTKNPGPAGGGKKSEMDLDEHFLKSLAAQNGGQCVIR